MVWQLLENRIPTKDSLCHRGVISSDEALCPWCTKGIENSCHLFLHCRFSAAVWNALTRWLGVVIVIAPNVLLSYVIFVTHGSNKRRKKGYSMIWLAFVWIFGNLEMIESLIIKWQQWRMWWILFNAFLGDGS
jgi:hypothetical protein